jgi:outer membrane protein OmpA-like peptidoglycan-associated protein
VQIEFGRLGMKGYGELFQRQRGKAVAMVATALVALGFSVPLPVNSAVLFQANMDASSWVVDSSVHHCRISHEIPYFGRAVFEQPAGEQPRFQLQQQLAHFKVGQASLRSVPPQWKPSGEVSYLGRVDIQATAQPILVEGQALQRLLNELFAGQQVVFSHAQQHELEQLLQVALSPVNFRPAYQQYQACLARLLPVNYEQIRRTAVYFPSGSDTLPPADLVKLDQIALYVEADDSVQSFVVDGHTDSAGDRSGNLELSQRRTEQVVTLLVERGIPLEKITSRWHGERYPVATNRTLEGRTQNRRVTIRLERASGGGYRLDDDGVKVQQDAKAPRPKPLPAVPERV